VSRISYRADLQTITDEIPNTIRAIYRDLPESRDTCAMHAFRFEESADYAAIAGYGLGIVHAGSDCFTGFIANRLPNEVTGPGAKRLGPQPWGDAQALTAQSANTLSREAVRSRPPRRSLGENRLKNRFSFVSQTVVACKCLIGLARPESVALVNFARESNDLQV